MRFTRFLGLLSLLLPVLASAADAPLVKAGRHALLVTVSTYGGGLPRVPGAARDAEQAKLLLNALGVPEQHVVILKDREATADAIREAASDLTLRLAPSDQVLVYFSGLGSRRQDMDRPGGCEETFIAADGEQLGFGELGTLFLPLVERAEKTLVIYDACASAQRGAPGATRCVAPEPASDCRIGGNTRWRSLLTEVRKSAVSSVNVISANAARPEEAAYDDGAAGGLFSGGLRRCLQGNVADLDGSGAISFGELAACAQSHVDRQAPEGRAPRIALQGNRGYVPFLKATGSGGSNRLLDDLFAGRDGRREMIVQKGSTPAGDPTLSLRASTVGYLYLVGSDGAGNFSLLFPNARDRENRIKAGETFVFPRPGSGAVLPRGQLVLAVLADNERDMAVLPGSGAAPIPADPTGRQAVFQFVTTSVRAREAPCQASGKARNLSLVRACSDAYAAGLISVEPR